MRIREGKNILEVGCGTGIGILHALNFIDKDAKYYATDISVKMV